MNSVPFLMTLKVFLKTLYFRDHMFFSCQIQDMNCPIPYVHMVRLPYPLCTYGTIMML